MIRYHPTNGERGELCVDWDGNFVGCIVRHSAARWSAYTRTLELIGDNYGSRGQAAVACAHRAAGKQKIPMAEILACRVPAE
jgi:hypothetical protein